MTRRRRAWTMLRPVRSAGSVGVAGARELLLKAEKSGKTRTPDDTIRLAAAFVAVGDVDHAIQLVESIPEGSGDTERVL